MNTQLAGSTRIGLVALALAMGASAPAAAQSDAHRDGRWDLNVSSGKVIPTGDQRATVERGDLTTAQLSYAVRPSLALTATVGWARSRDIVADHDRKLDLFTYDVGVESRAPDLISRGAFTFSPFAGAGLGGRSYSYRRFDADATHDPAAYVAAGGQLGFGPVQLRVEARNYVSAFSDLDGAGNAGARSDIALVAGLSWER